MKSMLPSILIALFIALPFLACSLPPDSPNGSQQVPQPKRMHQGMEVTSGEYVSLFDVQFSPDGTLLAIATDICILLYNTKTYDKPEILIGHTPYISSLAFRPDGKVLASVGKDATVSLWDVNTRQHIRTLEIDLYNEGNIVFSPDGKMLACGGGRGDRINNVYLWDADTGKSLRTFSGHTNVVTDVAFSPDGKVLASTAEDFTVRLWDVNTGQQIRTLTEQIRTPPEQIIIPEGGLNNGLVRRCLSIAFSPDGNMLVSGGGFRNTVDLWDVNTGQQRLLINARYFETMLNGFDMAFSPDGNTIAATGYFSIHLWDTESGQYHRILYHNGPPKCPIGASDIAFSPDGSTIACVSFYQAHVWDVKTEKLIRLLINRREY